MDKVSIIIPVYNVENYISECLNSVINQTYKNLEIIVVDDGSPDKSGEICDNFAKKDNRIIVIHKENSGVSNARNIALEKCTGKYACFVDSDDYVEKDFVEKLVENIDDTDMVICGYYEKYKNNEIAHSAYKSNASFDKNKAIDLLFARDYYGGYLWNKLFKKSLLEKINFDNNIHMLEDLLFVVKYMLNCNNIKVITNNLYYYRMRKSSAVMGKNKQKFYSMFESHKQIYNLLYENKIDMNYFSYMLCLDLITHRKIVKEKNLMNNISERRLFVKILFSSKYSIKLKIKLIIKKYFKFIFRLYMGKKRNNNFVYD